MDTDWKVEFAESSERELDRLPAKVKIKALEKIKLLQLGPTQRGVKKRAGNDYYSIRFCGNRYRVVFRLFSEQRLILITRVRHRGDAYRGL
jgi:mRNA-degrading endonuclease RelE of RelBE toxin-antitoxin system